MAHDRADTKKRLDALWKQKLEVLDIVGNKYVMISDVHLGNDSGADDFRENKFIMVNALEKYNAQGYTLILLGDIEELWQFDLAEIRDTYDDSVYEAMRQFGDRIIRVFGNHDIDWSWPEDPIHSDGSARRRAVEAVKMRYKKGDDPKILLLHGHQGSTESDKSSWISRLAVHGPWTPIESAMRWLGIYGNPSYTKSQVTQEFEQIYHGWAKRKKVMVICGHSHRAIFASRSYAEKLEEEIEDLQLEIQQNSGNTKLIEEKIKQITEKQRVLLKERMKGRDIDPMVTGRKLKPCFFNTGCALYTNGITAIELDDQEIRLVKWHAPKQAAADVLEHESIVTYLQSVCA